MMAWMNAVAVARTLETGRVTYWSRSRGLWIKGETSGAVQELRRIDLDCDRDALRFTVRQHGADAFAQGNFFDHVKGNIGVSPVQTDAVSVSLS